jgi:actin-like ATPase involved in cell morphogenesis
MNNTPSTQNDLVVDTSERFVLAVDFGTSYTMAAARIGDRAPEVIEIAGERRVPSVIVLDTDGDVLVGRTADDLAATSPGRVLRAPKSRLGEPAPVVLGGRPFAITTLVADLLRSILDAATRYHGRAPDEVRLTHPATWSRPRRQQLIDAAALAGITDPVLVPEPVAAAIAYADDSAIEVGSHVLVYDLGGGTFDTAALQRSVDGFVVLGRPNGDPRLGGELFDELLANTIGERLEPAVWEQIQLAEDGLWDQAAMTLRSQARRAKEALSSAPYADVLLGLPTGLVQLRLERADLDAVVEPYIRESIEILQQTAASAGLDTDDVAAIYLVGGASRMPLVERLVREAYPTTQLSLRGDPKGVVAIGATHPNATPTTLAQRSSLDRITAVEPVVAVPALPVPPNATVVDGATVIESGTVIESVVDDGTMIDTDDPVTASNERSPSVRILTLIGAAAAAIVLVVGAVLAFGGGDGGADDVAGPDTTDRSNRSLDPLGDLTVERESDGADPNDSAPITVPVTAPSTTIAASPDTTPDISPDTTPDTTPVVVVPDDAALQASLLAPTDLSDGWTPVPEETLRDTTPFCGETPNLGVVRDAVSGFERFEGLAYRNLVSTISVFDSPTAAAANFDANYAVLANCTATTLDIDGTTLTMLLQVQLVDAATLATLPCGDQAGLVVVTLSDPATSVPVGTQTSQSVRCGANIMTFVSAGTVGPTEAAILLDDDFLNGSNATLRRASQLPGSA